MNIQEAKQIKIADYLQSLGHRPVKQQLSYHHTGFRPEHQVLADEIKRKFSRINGRKKIL